MVSVWDAPSDVVWEPWTPKVGDRVRIRLNGECSKVWQWRNAPNLKGWNGHPPEFDGELGIVDAYVPETTGDHPYVVLFDNPVELREVAWKGAFFAAAELELVGTEG